MSNVVFASVLFTLTLVLLWNYERTQPVEEVDNG
jgi:hypothetical protein